MNENVSAKREPTGCELIISRLEYIAGQSAEQSSIYRELVGKITYTTLESETLSMPKSSSSANEEPLPDTFFVRMDSLLSNLERTNKKNSEIITEFRKII
jgi:hypothetical protein